MNSQALGMQGGAPPRIVPCVALDLPPHELVRVLAVLNPQAPFVCPKTLNPHPLGVQGGAPPRIVPRVVLELPPQELMRVLGDPAPLARLLRGLCDEHGFDGLVAPSNAQLALPICHCGRPRSVRNSACRRVQMLCTNGKSGGTGLVPIFRRRVHWTGMASFSYMTSSANSHVPGDGGPGAVDGRGLAGAAAGARRTARPVCGAWGRSAWGRAPPGAPHFVKHGTLAGAADRVTSFTWQQWRQCAISRSRACSAVLLAPLV